MKREKRGLYYCKVEMDTRTTKKSCAPEIKNHEKGKTRTITFD